MKLEIQDIYGTNIELTFSRSGYFRIDLDHEKFFPKTKHERTGEEIPVCLSLEYRQAKLLKEMLEAMLEKAEAGFSE